MTLIDISPALHARSPVFPGDTPFSTERVMSINHDCPVNVSRITLSVHVGAHADAPLHYAPDGAAIDEVSLEPYIGVCSVIDCCDATDSISAKFLAARIEKPMAPRILLKTSDAAPRDNWDPDFVAIGADAIDWLASRGALLIGVDTPSLDPASSKTMAAHMAVRRADMRILENLELGHVVPGRYELLAPPLKLKGLDAAPVRAVLRTINP
jgi:arylformamidase